MKDRTAAAIIILVVLIAGATVYFDPLQNIESTSTTTLTQSSVLVSDPTPFFPTGYESKVLNFTGLSNGTVINVAQIPFWIDFPSNLETRTTTMNGVQTTITVTADYQCGISMGQRKFFHAQFPNGQEMKLDYCLVLNTAVQMAMRSNNMSMVWSLWQISLNTYPTVALHMIGTGENVASTELWVSTYTPAS